LNCPNAGIAKTSESATANKMELMRIAKFLADSISLQERTTHQF
jgi:hypothetical protein